MPSPIDKIKYTEQQDGRRKILTSQYPQIRKEYKELKSIRAVAKLYGVNKRLIQFIIYPERLAALKEHNKKIKHHRRYPITKEENKERMRKFRARKRKILSP